MLSKRRIRFIAKDIFEGKHYCSESDFCNEVYETFKKYQITDSNDKRAIVDEAFKIGKQRIDCFDFEFDINSDLLYIECLDD